MVDYNNYNLKERWFTMIEIIYVNNGIANCIGNYGNYFIEINKELKKYPELHKKILKHEIIHTKTKSKFDFMHELKDSFDLKTQWQLLKFQVKHPSSWSSFLPIIKTSKGAYSFDSFKILIYLTYLIIIIFVMGG